MSHRTLNSSVSWLRVFVASVSVSGGEKMIDYHVHPDFSPDADGSIEEYCARAVELGLEEICFTTHYEPDPVRKDIEEVRVNGRAQPVDSDWPEAYFAALQAARAKFPGVTVLAGVEVGYEPGLEGIISDFLRQHQFDFVLGAIHCLDHIAITAGDELGRFKSEYMSRGPESVAERYFHHLHAAAGSQLFDCLAHLDIYRKYVESLYDQRFGAAVETLLPSVLNLVAQSGAGIEVNSSALRRGNPYCYPSPRILRLARAAGVRVFTVGSDAHRPADLGKGLESAVQALKGLGVEPARFRRRRLLSVV
jgi:histidinol-phosphatase (PHP family)